MLKRLLKSNYFIAIPPFRKLMTGLLLAVAGAWILTACGQEPAPAPKTATPTESSQAAVRVADPSPQLSAGLTSAIEQVANKAIPAVVHIEVTEHQELANPYYAYRDNPFFRHFFGLPKNMPK